MVSIFFLLVLGGMESNVNAQKPAETSTVNHPNIDTGNLLPAPQSSPSPMQRLDSSQSLAHLPPDTAFMIHERTGSDLLDITPISTADEWTRSHGSLPHHLRLHTCETMQMTGKRPSLITKLFRSKSTNNALLQHSNNDDDFVHTLRTSDNNSISISIGDETRDINRSNTILYRSPTLDASNYPNQIDDDDDSYDQDLDDTGLQSGRSAMNRTNHGLTSTRHTLSPSTTTTTMTNSSNTTRRPSRFSFISRRTTRLRSVLSRPPSYKRYDNPEQEEQQARDIAALRRLEQYYENERNTGLLHQLLWAEEGEKVPVKQVLLSCIADQFTGFYMAFWIIIFVFLGAVSVFVPGLPQAAKALWIPLALYCIGVLVFFSYHRRHATKIYELEQQIGRARRRRLNELLSNMELPSDHYFVIEDRSTSHAHPVVTLLPPPPNYAPMTRPTMTGATSSPPQYNTEDRFLSPQLPPQQQQLASSSPTNSSVPMLAVSPSISHHPRSPPPQQQQQEHGQERDIDQQDDSTHMWQVSQAEETMELERSSHPLHRP
ncbi:unnamed protein product [Absidia cylindrospora]